MTDTEKWYAEVGSTKLADVLCCLMGKRIRAVPLANLEIGVPEWADLRQLAELISAERIKAILWNYSSDDADVLIDIV